MKIFDFDEGLAETIRMLESITSDPKIISAFGVPDSGKTYLIESIGKYFESLGIKVKQRENREGINMYEVWSPWVHSDLKRQISEDCNGSGLVMYHCPWGDRGTPWNNHLDPEIVLREILGRGLDLSIGIFNPKRSLTPRGNYNLVIRNSLSSEKPVSYDD